MGQRLNIEIEFNGKPLANCYFHWSAYTVSSIALVKEILKTYLDEIKSADLPDTVKAIRCLEACSDRNFMTGEINYAGLTPESYKIATEQFKGLTFKEAVSRNSGLIHITEKEMEETRSWEEGRVEIDITNEIVRFYVFWDLSLSEQIAEEYDEAEDEDEENVDDLVRKYLDLPVYIGDMAHIKFSEFEKFANFVCSNYEFITLDSNGNSCVTSRIE